MSITRERLLEIIVTGPEASGAEQNELARMALAAMDSESWCLPLDYLQGHKDGLEWASQLAEANHPETGDWLYDDPIELAKAIRKGPDMPPAQPVADSEPDRNPVLAYADSYRDMAKQGVESVPIWSVITDLERNIAPLYRHAQPAPVVPDEIKHRIGGLDWGWEGEFNRGWNACRAAMLQAGTLTNGGTSLQDNHSVDDTEKVNSPVIPDGSVAMLRRWLAFGRGMQNAGIQLPHNLIAETESMLAAAPTGIPMIPDGYVMVPKQPTAEMISSGIAAHYERSQIQIHDRPAIGPIEFAYIAMLAASPQPQNAPQNIPEIIPGWIPVSERMPPPRYEVLVGCWWGEKPRWCCKWATYIPGHPDSQSSGWLIPGASWTPTHWMPLPAAPQEVKDAHH